MHLPSPPLVYVRRHFLPMVANICCWVSVRKVVRCPFSIMADVQLRNAYREGEDGCWPAVFTVPNDLNAKQKGQPVIVLQDFHTILGYTIKNARLFRQH